MNETNKEMLTLSPEKEEELLKRTREEIEKFLERRRLAEIVSDQALRTRMTI